MTTEIKSADLCIEVGVSRQMLSRWSHEGLRDAAQIRRGWWNREAALSWIADRREDSPQVQATSSDLLRARVELYTLQAGGQRIRNDLAEANVVSREMATRSFSEATAEQIAAGDAWARDATTDACKPLLAHVSPAQALALKAELWNEIRSRQAESIRRVAGALAVGEDVGSARIRIPRSVGG